MKKIITDVVIVGGGGSGLAAGVAAAEKGAKVVVLEKNKILGGCSNLAMGMLGVETKLQKKFLVDTTKESAFKKFMDYTHWRANAALVKNYLDLSASTIEWFMGMGVEFLVPSKYFPGSDATWHLVKKENGEPGLGAVAIIVKQLAKRLKELGGEIYLQTPAKKLLKNGERIVGVEAEGMEIESKAVVLAAGGFSDNPEFIRKYTGYKFNEDLYSYVVSGITGDGLKMAWEAGAAQDRMDMELVFFAPNTGGYAPVELPFRQPNLFINLDGKRFYDEAVVENPVFSVNAIARQKKRVAYSIIDQAMLDRYNKEGLDLINVVTANMNMGFFMTELEKAEKSGSDVLFFADTLEELADKIGVNKQRMLKTFADYNEYCATGIDREFNKNSKYLKPFTGGRYYALKFMPSAYASLGGLRVNEFTQVMNVEEDPIPGLYGCGTDANTICNPDYVFVLPGNSMGFAFNSGRMAGMNAADYVKTVK